MTEEPPAPQEMPDNVIALSQYRARIGRGKRTRRIDTLRSQPHPEQAIQALPGDELYYLLREDEGQGHDAKDLLAHARPEQIQVVLDFGLWSGDHMVPERLEEWVGLMAEMPYETIGPWIRGLDIELVALLIRKAARIYDLEIEDPPDEPAGLFYPTPDRLFVLDVVGYSASADSSGDEDVSVTLEGDEAGESEAPSSAHALIQIIDNLYRSDATLARRILVGAKAELDSQLEEMALRWRQGRMADLGFIDTLEALEIYRELDPATVRIGELRPGTRMRPQASVEFDERAATPDQFRMPSLLGDDPGRSSYFRNALARVSSQAEIDELHFALVALTNRVLAADRVDAADEQAAAASLGRMRATLDLAVEFLARGGGATATAVDEDRAVDAVRTIALVRLFRLGVSLVGKVRTLGRTLSRQGPFAALPQLDLVEEPEAAVLAALLRTRPLYASSLDDPPTAGERPFASLADIARATAAIERAAVAQAMLLGLGVRPQDLLPEALEGVEPADPVEIDTGVLARTALLLLLQKDDPLKDPKSDPKTDLGVVRRGPGKQAPRFRPLKLSEISDLAPASVNRAPAKRSKGKPFVGSAAPITLPEVLLARARRVLEQVAPPRMGSSAREMTERWLETLSPLQPVLTRQTGKSKRPPDP